MGAGRPEGEEDADDAVDEGEDDDGDAGAAEPKGSVEHLLRCGGEAFVQKHGGGKGGGGVEGCDDEGRQGVESDGISNVDECEEKADEGGETDAIERKGGARLNLFVFQSDGTVFMSTSFLAPTNLGKRCRSG